MASLPAVFDCDFPLGPVRVILAAGMIAAVSSETKPRREADWEKESWAKSRNKGKRSSTLLGYDKVGTSSLVVSFSKFKKFCKHSKVLKKPAGGFGRLNACPTNTTPDLVKVFSLILICNMSKRTGRDAGPTCLGNSGAGGFGVYRVQ